MRYGFFKKNVLKKFLMENWEQNCINILKHLKFNNINTSDKFIPWENIDPIKPLFSKLHFIKKIRIIINESNISKCLDYHIKLGKNNYHTTIPIKLATLFEYYFFSNNNNENKIYYDKIIGGWVIPINLSLFTNDNQYNYLYIEEMNENYFFQIQMINVETVTNNKLILKTKRDESIYTKKGFICCCMGKQTSIRIIYILYL